MSADEVVVACPSPWDCLSRSLSWLSVQTIYCVDVVKTFELGKLSPVTQDVWLVSLSITSSEARFCWIRTTPYA